MREYHAGYDEDEGLVTTNCEVCGEDTGNEVDTLCQECQADADHEKFVDDCYNADYDRSMML